MATRAVPPPGKSFRVLVFPSDNPAATLLLLPPLISSRLPTRGLTTRCKRLSISRRRCLPATDTERGHGSAAEACSESSAGLDSVSLSLSLLPSSYLSSLSFCFSRSLSLSVSSVSAVPTEKLISLHRGASAFLRVLSRERDRRRCSLRSSESLPVSLSLSLLPPAYLCISVAISSAIGAPRYRPLMQHSSAFWIESSPARVTR